MPQKNSLLTKQAQLEQIAKELHTLTESPLYEYRTTNGYLPVIGEGSADARIMLVGEAPGKNEAKTGRPFAGAAGTILNDLLSSVSIAREDVYITNIVKDRPQENRDPTAEEITIYGPFLDRQIEIIQPSVIATLGRYSMTYILSAFGLAAENIGISKLHGKSFPAMASYGPVSLVILYHPAAAIYNQSLKPALREDFAILAARP
jgi:uracil-DNA glycosylase family 4